MPPVMRPLATSSAQEVRDTLLFPGWFRGVQLRGGSVLGPHDFEVAALPLAHGAGDGRVLAALEADAAQDGLELVLGDLLAQGLAVQTRFFHGLLQDLQACPGVAAGPAVGLLVEL